MTPVDGNYDDNDSFISDIDGSAFKQLILQNVVEETKCQTLLSNFTVIGDRGGKVSGVRRCKIYQEGVWEQVKGPPKKRKKIKQAGAELCQAQV